MVEPPRRHEYTWFIDRAGLFETLAGLSAREAWVRIVARGSTIAGHADHLRWSLAMANAIARGESPSLRWAESWNVGEVDDERWARLREDLRREYEAFHARLTPGFDLADRETLFGVLGMIAHAAYHLGAIRQRALARGEPGSPA